MAQPAAELPLDRHVHSEIRWASQELYFFDDVFARPMNAHPSSGTIVEATASERGTALAVWRGPCNRIGLSAPDDGMWARIVSPDRGIGVAHVPQAVNPDAAGCGVLLGGEPPNGIVGRGVHALVAILELADPLVRGLDGPERERAYLLVNAAIIRGMHA